MVNPLKVIFSWRMLLFWILIVVTLFVAHATSGWLEAMVIAGNSLAWAWLFIWYLIWLGGVGTGLAYLFMRWK